MKSLFITPVLLAALLLIPFVSLAKGKATVKWGGKSVSLDSSFQSGMQCILNKLKSNKSYVPKSVGCYGKRPNASAHPFGQACDTDQTSRDKAAVNKFASASSQNSIAESCNAVSGCKWRDRDCGHWERRSAQYTKGATAGKKGSSKKKKATKSSKKSSKKKKLKFSF